MARQNYQHGKRQRELAKKQKHDEKLQRRMERKNNPLSDDPNAQAEPVEGMEPIAGAETTADTTAEATDTALGTEAASEASVEPEGAA